jgi:hypothetical protein
MLPKNPVILLSMINMKLRDQYADLDALCDDMELDRADLEEKLNAIDYFYDPKLNQFK